VSKKIAPMGIGEIRAVFHPRGYKGRISKTIRVHSNDPVTPVVTLTVSATVAERCPWLEQKPAKIE
jgi:hypothetical protein